MIRSKVADGWRAEGRAEGRIEERLKLLRDGTLRAIRARFGENAVNELAPVVETQSDSDVLDRWFELALTAKLPEVRRQLGGE